MGGLTEKTSVAMRKDGAQRHTAFKKAEKVMVAAVIAGTLAAGCGTAGSHISYNNITSESQPNSPDRRNHEEPKEEVSLRIDLLKNMSGMKEWRNSLPKNIQVFIGDHGSKRIDLKDEKISLPLTQTGSIVADPGLKTRLFPGEEQPAHPKLALIRGERVSLNLEIIILRPASDGSFLLEYWPWIESVSDNAEKTGMLMEQALFAAHTIQKIDASGKLLTDPNGKPLRNDTYIEGLPALIQFSEWAL